jgi:hypothetical protein
MDFDSAKPQVVRYDQEIRRNGIDVSLPQSYCGCAREAGLYERIANPAPLGNERAQSHKHVNVGALKRKKPKPNRDGGIFAANALA